MLRDCEPGRKTSAKKCPHCGAAGNYAGHGSYERWLDDGGGARRVRVDRVKCLSCGRTHALIWKDMVPYKLRSEGLHLRTFREWAGGSPFRRLLAATSIPRTSLRRMLSHVGSRLSLMLARPPTRRALSAAIADVADAALSSMHLSRFGRMLAEGANLRNIPQPCPPAGGGRHMTRRLAPGTARDHPPSTAREVARKRRGGPFWTRRTRGRWRSRTSSWG